MLFATINLWNSVNRHDFEAFGGRIKANTVERIENRRPFQSRLCFFSFFRVRIAKIVPSR